VIESKVSLWRERVADWRASGLTADEFASRHGLVAGTLRWWSRRLETKYGDAPRMKPTTAPVRPRAPRSVETKRPEIRVAKIVQLTPTAEPTRYGAVVVELSEGRTQIRFERGADLKMAAKLVTMLARMRKR
jgi:transposase-like protein